MPSIGLWSHERKLLASVSPLMKFLASKLGARIVLEPPRNAFPLKIHPPWSLSVLCLKCTPSLLIPSSKRAFYPYTLQTSPFQPLFSFVKIPSFPHYPCKPSLNPVFAPVLAFPTLHFHTVPPFRPKNASKYGKTIIYGLSPFPISSLLLCLPWNQMP